jgi:arylformamidase
MTATQLIELYDDSLSIPNFFDLLQQNRVNAKIMKDRLQPFSDIAYGKEAIQKLDIYAPKNAKNSAVLIDIHGGGWVAGSKNARSIPAEFITEENVIWVPIDYGLAPEYKMATLIAHIRSALVWAYQNINHYGGDRHRIYITGQSAGAHLAATALMPGWHQHFDVPEDFIKGLVALSGIYDLKSLIHSPDNPTKDALGLTLEEAQGFSPLFHLPQKSIPCIIAYGSKEPLAYRYEAEIYAKALMVAGCNVSLIKVPDANHFDMINELANTGGELFKASMAMICPKKL